MASSAAAPVSAALEEDRYLDRWTTHKLFERAPADMAYEGGLLADRPAWVFVAGYQAALRALFPEVESAGWIAFAVSEDRDAQSPVTAIPDESEWLLHGSKHWVAQSRVITDLIVTARLRDRTELFRTSARIKGLTLAHRAAPTFLAAMSQAKAHFDAVPAARLDAPERRKLFGVAEALAVMIATGGYVARYTGESAAARASADQLRAVIAQLRTMLQNLDSAQALEVLALDQQFHRALGAWFEATDTSALVDYESDRRLFTLYRAGIAKRADSATIRVAEPD